MGKDTYLPHLRVQHKLNGRAWRNDYVNDDKSLFSIARTAGMCSIGSFARIARGKNWDFSCQNGRKSHMQLNKFYVDRPMRSLVGRTMQLVLRTGSDPSLAARGLISAVRAADPSEPVYHIKSMEQIYSDERSGVQASARIMTGNAVIALFLAVTGIYGVISYFVSQRTKEIVVVFGWTSFVFSSSECKTAHACILGE
jgi:hypothetical protein